MQFNTKQRIHSTDIVFDILQKEIVEYDGVKNIAACT